MPAHRHLLRSHDRSSHGGHVLPQPNRPLIASKAQALVGDLVYCPQCKDTFPIVGWQPSSPLATGAAAADGMVTACGARLKASQRQQSTTVDFLQLAQTLLKQFAQMPETTSAFEDPQYPHNSTHNPFAKPILIQQLQARLSQSLALPNLTTPYIQQGPSSLCGPASFAHCLLQDRPDIYVATILALWQHGQAKMGDLWLRPSRHARRPKRFTLASSGGLHTHLPMVDWLLLASLKDSSNRLLAYASPQHKTAGMTFWPHLNRWFTAVGATQISHFYALFGSSAHQLALLKQQWHSGQHIIALIGAGMLHNGRGRFSNHWVVFTDPPPWPTTTTNDFTQLPLFSWGQVRQQCTPGLSHKRFKQHLYGAWIYSQIP